VTKVNVRFIYVTGNLWKNNATARGTKYTGNVSVVGIVTEYEATHSRR
jgi:hypothetical protein